MSDPNTQEPAGGELDEHAGRLLAVLNLLAEMTVQALKQGGTDAARGFVDCIETLSVKTAGNVGATEAQAFESVLYQLRLAVVQGPPPEEEGAGESGEGDGAEPAEGGDPTDAEE